MEIENNEMEIEMAIEMEKNEMIFFPFLMPNPLPPYLEFNQQKKRVGQREWKDPLYKAGRNDPCPCGSQKKFKYCCFGKKKVEK
jgi:uncharacterized protein YecA (UPF0149 family)